jgi:hypothetical protein
MGTLRIVERLKCCAMGQSEKENPWDWQLVKDPQLRCVVVDTAKKLIRYNPILAMVKFETASHFIVYEWDLKKPEEKEDRKL